ncbi:MAG: hypothetical protein KIT84_37495 [Labilithrix sp.]|nr:hypothetical protein [Labilithrix sp.]
MIAQPVASVENRRPSPWPPHRIDDASKRRADVLGVATHRAVVDRHALRQELEGDAMKRHPPSVFSFFCQQEGDERRREHAAVDDPRGFGAVVLGRRLAVLVERRRLVRRHMTTHGARAPPTKQVMSSRNRCAFRGFSSAGSRI